MQPPKPKGRVRVYFTHIPCRGDRSLNSMVISVGKNRFDMWSFKALSATDIGCGNVRVVYVTCRRMKSRVCTSEIRLSSDKIKRYVFYVSIGWMSTVVEFFFCPNIFKYLGGNLWWKMVLNVCVTCIKDGRCSCNTTDKRRHRPNGRLLSQLSSAAFLHKCSVSEIWLESKMHWL